MQAIQLLTFDLMRNSLPMSFQVENCTAPNLLMSVGLSVAMGTLLLGGWFQPGITFTALLVSLEEDRRAENMEGELITILNCIDIMVCILLLFPGKTLHLLLIK